MSCAILPILNYGAGNEFEGFESELVEMHGDILRSDSTIERDALEFAASFGYDQEVIIEDSDDISTDGSNFTPLRDYVPYSTLSNSSTSSGIDSLLADLHEQRTSLDPVITEVHLYKGSPTTESEAASDENDSEMSDMPEIATATRSKDVDADTLESFISETELRECETRRDLSVRKYFRRKSFEGKEICKIAQMSKTELWEADCVYGYKFQVWICRRFNLKLPQVSQKVRKQQIKPKKYRIGSQLNQEAADLDLEESQLPTTEQKRTSPRDQVLLHIFVLDLLNHPYYQTCIKWQDTSRYVFKVINTKKVAELWQKVKENETCNYENFARGIRFSRKRGYFCSLEKHQKKVYQLHKKAIDDYVQRTGRHPLSSSS